MNIIGIKELQNNLKMVKEKTLKGEEFFVTSSGKTVFRIVPFQLSERGKKLSKKESLAMIKKMQFDGADPKLSQNIDEIACQ